jgi:signal transduction histidine kinase
MRDTSDEQRRRLLERMFFHDVLNSAGGLHNLLRLLPKLSTAQAASLTHSAEHLAAQVVEEIQAQRDLAAAERGDLVAREQDVAIGPLLDDTVALYQNHTVAEGKKIALEAASEPARLVTDPLLLRRVLGNLLKNALEASEHGDVVALRFSHPKRPVFEVHNEAVMSTAVKLQIFQRSFSTKGGHGRGVGTYSARLLTERLLGGELTFESEPGRGTTFVVKLPARQ